MFFGCSFAPFSRLNGEDWCCCLCIGACRLFLDVLGQNECFHPTILVLFPTWFASSGAKDSLALGWFFSCTSWKTMPQDRPVCWCLSMTLALSLFCFQRNWFFRECFVFWCWKGGHLRIRGFESILRFVWLCWVNDPEDRNLFPLTAPRPTLCPWVSSTPHLTLLP